MSGCFVCFSSSLCLSVYVCVFQVCYTQGKYIQVRVHSEVFDPLTQQHNTTNVFHYTFASDCDVPNIIPKTYGGEPTRTISLQHTQLTN